MANYNIFFTKSAEKSLKKLPKKDLINVIKAVEDLANNPYPNGCRKLAGEYSTFRIRVGYYRIIYEIEDKLLKIIVLKLGHRKDIYR